MFIAGNSNCMRVGARDLEKEGKSDERKEVKEAKKNVMEEWKQGNYKEGREGRNKIVAHLFNYYSNFILYFLKSNQ